MTRLRALAHGDQPATDVWDDISFEVKLRVHVALHPSRPRTRATPWYASEGEIARWRRRGRRDRLRV
jgi:hypothetical protein